MRPGILPGRRLYLIGYVDETDEVDGIIAAVYSSAEEAAEKIINIIEITDDRRNDHG